VLLLAVLASTPNAEAQTTPPSQDPPNILVIITDDQRAVGSLGVMPDTRRWFVDGGRRYTNAFASTPLCCPSRASFLTGRYAHNHGVLDNLPDHKALPGSTWFSSYLQGAGYRTGMFGKVMNGWNLKGEPSGFHEWATFTNGYYDERWNVNGTMKRIHTYSTKFIQFRANDFLRDAELNDDQPWLLYMTPYAPHVPSTPQPKYADAPIGSWSGDKAVRERDLGDKPPWLRVRNCSLTCGRRVRARQLRTLMSVDDMVAAVRDRLEQLGETNTLAIYTTDNGYMWGDHGQTGKNQPWTHPAKLPFYMRWPGHVAPGETSSDMVLNIDVAPTALEVAGVAPPSDPVMDGRSLLTSPPRDRVLLEHWCSNRGCDYWASTRNPASQYIERYDETGRRIFREYYDLIEDPWQLRNVFLDGRPGNRPANLSEIVAQLQQDRTCVGTACP
jgi:arylsulfatase A-like enzyme